MGGQLVLGRPCDKMDGEKDRYMRNAIVLAAGKGTRMHSENNKVMHPLIDRPILQYVLEALKEAGAQRIVVITGYQAKSIQDAYPGLEFALQEPQLGTGHAVMQAKALENEEGATLVINGDGPCIQPETLKKLYEANEGASLTLLSSILEDGGSYGRIIRDENQDVQAIVEARDCTDEQKAVREVNAGIYCFDNQDLFAGLKKLTTNNAQNEYYLTDLVRILREEGKIVRALPVENPDEVQGVNDPIELYSALQWLQDKYNKNWMKQGVQIVDPARTLIGKDAKIGHDVIIWPDTEILNDSVIEDFAEILPGSYIKNAHIGKHAKVQMSVIEDADVKDGETVTGSVKKGR